MGGAVEGVAPVLGGLAGGDERGKRDDRGFFEKVPDVGGGLEGVGAPLPVGACEEQHAHPVAERCR